MSDNVQVIAAYKLPAPIGVTADCFGKSMKVKIGDIDGRALLPVLRWIGEEPKVVSPIKQIKLAEHVDHYVIDDEEPVHYWGEVDRYNTKQHRVDQAFVGAIVIELDLDDSLIEYSDYLYGRGSPQSVEITKLFQDIDEWFNLLRTWIEAALDQDVNPSNPLDRVTIAGHGLEIFTREGKITSLPTTASNIVITTRSHEAVTLSLLRRLIKHTNARTMPSDAHLLLGASRAELRRMQYRRAVIDAGSAAELTLADFNNRVTMVTKTGSPPTLG